MLGVVMTTYYDVPANFLIPALAEELMNNDAIKMPDWADVVKTGSSRERPQPKKIGGIPEVQRFSEKLLDKDQSESLHYLKNTVVERITDPNQTHQVSVLVK